jgi:hypothetical protein
VAEHDVKRQTPKNRSELVPDLQELLWAWAYNAPAKLRPNTWHVNDPTANMHKSVHMGEHTDLTYTADACESLAETVVDFLIANGLISEANFRS